MIVSSPSTAVYGFVKDAVLAANTPADPASPLYQAQVMDSAFDEMTADRGCLVSNAEFDLAPRQLNEVDAIDAVVIMAFWVKVNPTGPDTSKRSGARDQCFAMARAVAAEIYGDMSLGGRVCDSMLERAVDGYRNSGSTEYSVINLPIILNPTGDAVSYSVGEVKR